MGGILAFVGVTAYSLFYMYSGFVGLAKVAGTRRALQARSRSRSGAHGHTAHEDESASCQDPLQCEAWRGRSYSAGIGRPRADCSSRPLLPSPLDPEHGNPHRRR